jgi:hypothetical protein
MFYRVQFIDRTGNPIKDDDVLLEKPNMKDAREYAEYRASGAYGYTEICAVHCVKRISRSEAIKMFNSNCIAWVNKDPDDY